MTFGPPPESDHPGTQPARTSLAVDELFELRVRVKDTYADVVSPQLPGASSVGGSDTAAIGNFIKIHGARLGVRVVYE